MRNFWLLDFPNHFALIGIGKGGGRGVMIYVHENIPSKLLTKHVLPSDIECIFLELNFRKCKWLLVGTYHPPSQNDHYFLENLDKAIDVYSHHEKVLLAGDFNAEISEFCLDSFLYQHELKNLVKEKTCFENVWNPSCIDLFLKNNALSFQHTETVSTGLSDFHELVSKSKPREIHYRNYNKFDSLKFNVDLKNAFAHEKMKSCIQFDEVFMKVLNRHAPLKKKILRANHSSYLSKTLRKAIMRRSYLENKYLKKN